MKRSPELASLSRDHHHALDAARILRRMNPTNIDESIADFLDFWNRHGRRHFAIEEELVLPALADDEAWAAAEERIRREHGGDPCPHGCALDPAARRGGQGARRALRDRVRYEERHLFALLEERLAPEALARLAHELAAAERAS
jgi:hypothetical protein